MVSPIEYGLIAALVAVAGVTAVQAIGTDTSVAERVEREMWEVPFDYSKCDWVIPSLEVEVNESASFKEIRRTPEGRYCIRS